jgi:hypothetical protein
MKLLSTIGIILTIAACLTLLVSGCGHPLITTCYLILGLVALVVCGKDGEAIEIVRRPFGHSGAAVNRGSANVNR